MRGFYVLQAWQILPHRVSTASSQWKLTLGISGNVPRDKYKQACKQIGVKRSCWGGGGAVGVAAWARRQNEDGHVENVDKIDHDGETGADAPFHPTTASANRFVDFSLDSFRSR